MLRFLGAWIVLSALDSFARGLNAGLNHTLASLVGWTLQRVGVPAVVRGSAVGFHGTTMLIIDPCNGLQLLVMLLAVVWAFPATWRARARALAWMIPLLMAINLFRLYTMAALLLFAPRVAEAVHLYVWQVLIIGAVLLIAGAWMMREGRRAPRPGRG